MPSRRMGSESASMASLPRILCAINLRARSGKSPSQVYDWKAVFVCVCAPTPQHDRMGVARQTVGCKA
jgi:hypothetical protein